MKPTEADVDLRRRLAALPLERKVRLLTGADFWTLHPEPAAGLRAVVTSDGPAGVRGQLWDERDPSANVPSPTALAATWDDALVERLGRLLAGEARRKGVDVLLAPTVNLHRTPYGGRHFENLSEDPLLTARIGVAYVRGVQAGGVAATVKHFVANDSETDRFTADVRVDDRTLRELYLAPFEAIVREAGVWAVMAAYNAVNGTTMTEHPMVNDVLKGEWGFDGVIMSDWFATRSTDAAGAGGLDLAMPGPVGPWGDALVEAVRAGRVPESAVDDKVLRLLRLAGRVGALDGVASPVAAAPPWSDQQIAAELRTAAAAGFVLVRNEAGARPDGNSGDPVREERPLLPLDAAGLRRVAVLGPNAAVARTLGGGSATVFPPYTVDPLAGLRAALGDGVRVDHSPGVSSTDRLPEIPVAQLSRPDGGSGVELRFLAADGTVLAGVDRSASRFTWLGSLRPDLPADVPITDVAAVEAHTRFRAPETGRYLIGASGIGPFRLTVEGTVAFDGPIELPAGADVVEGIMRPPQRSVPLDLVAGREVDLVVRHEPQITGGFGEFVLASVNLQLNAARQFDTDAELDRAVTMAAEADVAVVVVGTTEEVESEGFDRDRLVLPGRQDELVRRVVAGNPRTVVVVNAGAPVLLPWADEVPAVLLAWFPGQEFGNALADVLLGAVEPGGRLPTTWPVAEEGLPATRPVDGILAYAEGLLVGHRGGDAGARYPFGHGQGYTTWEYAGLKADETLAPGADAVVAIRVRNSGSRTGREVVQAYLSRTDSAIDRPVRWLAGYAAVTAEAGETADVELRIPARAFAHWDTATAAWATEPGRFQLAVGRSSRDLRLHTVVDQV